MELRAGRRNSFGKEPVASVQALVGNALMFRFE